MYMYAYIYKCICTKMQSYTTHNQVKKKIKKKISSRRFSYFFFPFQTSENLFSLQWKLANLKLRNSKIYL